MRDDLRDCCGRKSPEHLALAYGAWAPKEIWLKATGTARGPWLKRIADDTAISPDYRHAFQSWKMSFSAVGDRTAVFTASGRLLIGHGTPSPTEVGLSVHHTWGVPIIPGSALKGLLAHYLDATYGPSDMLPPWDYDEQDRHRAKFMGVTWDKMGRPERGPGEVYRALFGAPESDQDSVMRRHGIAAGAIGGSVTFHDALYVPGSCPEDRPFMEDVLTVHQTRYYGSDSPVWPNDYDDPIPVSFLTVRPDVKFQLALSGLPDWTELAAALLRDALREWGVGGKTSAGYGHGEVGPWSVPEPPAGNELKAFLSWLDAHKTDDQNYTQRKLLADIVKIWAATLATMDEPDFGRATDVICKRVRSAKICAARDEFLKSCRAREPSG